MSPRPTTLYLFSIFCILLCRAHWSKLTNPYEQVRDASGNVITEGFFYVGAEVTIHGHCFRVTEADDKTLRLMEERASNEFVYSNPFNAAAVLARGMDGRVGDIRAVLRENDAKVGGGWRRLPERGGLDGALSS